MKHLGDITKINGAEIEAVDVIAGGATGRQKMPLGGRYNEVIQRDGWS